MTRIPLTTNDDHYLLDQGRSVRSRPSSTIKILSLPDGSTLTLGEDDGDGSFSGYTNGTITEDVRLDHGVGARLMARTTGITDPDDPIIIGISE